VLGALVLVASLQNVDVLTLRVALGWCDIPDSAVQMDGVVLVHERSGPGLGRFE